MSKPQMAGAAEDRSTAASRSAAAHLDSFVINLCSSTTPMALAQPDAPELRRFKFFVSRRLEDGRERFRLHMGHFESLEEAEDWLGVVRDVYPGAWAGEAPGKRLREREAARAEPAQLNAPALPPEPPFSAHAVPAPPVAPAAPAAVQARAPSAPPPAPAARVSSIEMPGPPASPAGSPVLRTAAPAVPRSAPEVVSPAPVLPPQSARVAEPAAAPKVGARTAIAAPQAPAPARPGKGSARVPAPRAPVASLSNVREVLAALDERDPKVATPPAAQSLTDTQVMQILEARGNDKGAPQQVPNGIPMLRPDDTSTRRALKEAVRDNAAVAFAVQLQWAAEPLALDKVPPLAIFSAYTLYTVEGVRAGKKWHGLRLGFFADASAAKQLAHYVRSDFGSVAIVPVSQGERDRAVRKEHTTPAASLPRSPSVPGAQDEIPLFDADGAEPPRVSLKQGAVSSGSPSARAAAARSKRLRAEATVAEVVKAEHTLEETLEILGAGQLEIDNGRGEFFNDSSSHPRAEARKNSPFQRLLARLTERVRKN
jgi:hypothetical protein